MRLSIATGGSLLLLLTTAAAGGIDVGAPQPYPVGPFPAGLAVADLDGDLLPDVVTANVTSRDLSILTSHAMGGFFPEVRLDIGEEVRDVAVGDVTGDRIVDLVCCVRLGTAGIFVLPGLGGGSFGPPVPHGDPLAGFLGAFSMVLEDLDADGTLDVAVSSAAVDGSEVAVLLNDGAGGFPVMTMYPSGEADVVYVTDVEAGDMDGDGDTDLVSVLVNSGQVRLLRNAGDGTFGPPEPIGLDGSFPTGVALGDIDDDGDLDYAVVRQVFPEEDQLAIGFNDGTGAASPETVGVGDVTHSFTTPVAVTIADLDGDGVANEIIVQERLVRYAGGSYEQSSFSVAGRLLAVDAADLPFGPEREIVGAVLDDSFDGFVTVWPVEPGPPCPADVDGSGVVDTTDLLLVLGSWGPCDPCAADLDGNGIVDVADLLALLAAWGPCAPS